MTIWFGMAMTEALVDCRARQVDMAAVQPVISRLAKLRSRLMNWLARNRLRRSIAHLDDRLLADVGLSPDDLGFSERFSRRRAASLQSLWTYLS